MQIIGRRFIPARNALKAVRGKFKHLIYKSMITTTQRTTHGRRARPTALMSMPLPFALRHLSRFIP